MGSCRLVRRAAGGSEGGFTLTELLVVMLLAGAIVSGALHLATALLQTNQRDMGRTRVQTDLQRSLNYMAADLQQAVYVYDGRCLGQGDGQLQRQGCPGLVHHLPAGLAPESDRYPVLAFWRVSSLSATLLRHCRQGRLSPPACQSQHAYTLVVYLISTRDSSGIWRGEARLQRYTLAKFRQSGAPTPGYVDPSRFHHRFRTWPWYYRSGSASLVNQQQTRPSLRGNAPVPLVDFIAFSPQRPVQDWCPEPYEPTATATVLAQVDSVLGCARELQGQQEVMLTLRGHLPGAAPFAASGGVTLHTQITTRPRLKVLPPD